MLAQAWKFTGNVVSYLHSILEDCRILLSSLGTHSLVHVKRQCNMAADFMSKFAVSYSDNVWVEEGPPDLGQILLEDQSSLISINL